MFNELKPKIEKKEKNEDILKRIKDDYYSRLLVDLEIVENKKETIKLLKDCVQSLKIDDESKFMELYLKNST